MTLVAQGLGITQVGGGPGGVATIVELGDVVLDDISLSVTYAASRFDAMVPDVVLAVALEALSLVVSLDGDLAVTLIDDALVVALDC